jgi:outer membrane protein TolC
MSPIRSILVLAALACFALPGCHSDSFLNLTSSIEDYHEAVILPPAHTSEDGHAKDGGQPAQETPACNGTDAAVPISAVSTVVSPEANERHISLAECIAVALENGRTGEFFDGPGKGTSVSGLTRQTPSGAVTDSLRVFAYDPAILGTYIEESLAKFDAVWQTGLIWNRFNEPPAINTAGSPAFSLGPFNPGVLSTELGGLVTEFGTLGSIDLVQFRSELLKPLPTGGVAGITFRTDYQNQQNPFGIPLNVPFFPSVINPTYRPALDLSLEQPLLRGGGIGINQLRDTLTGSLLHPNLPVGGRAPGILLARIAHDEAQTEFERRVHHLLFAVEEAYWQLYCAYWDLYSRETGMKQTLAAWQIAKKRSALGGIAKEELAQIEEQFHSFRKQRLAALGRGSAGQLGVLEAERRLRYVIGLAPEDGTRLIPMDAPQTTPLAPDWTTSLANAMGQRPELRQIHQELKAGQLTLLKARDLLQPDLRFLGKYNVNGLGRDLSGAIENFEDSNHHDWEVGLLLQVPIGFREGSAEVTRAKLQLAQRFAFLRDQEAKIVFSLQRSYRDVVQFQEEVRIARSQEQAAAAQLQARYDKFKVGRETIDLLLRSQQKWVDALRDENVAICSYNVALADFERQKGTILEYDNVTLAEGPLPPCAQTRASEHIREWHRSLLLKKACPELPDRTDQGTSDRIGDQILPDLLHTGPAPMTELLPRHRNLPDSLEQAAGMLPDRSRVLPGESEAGIGRGRLGFTPLAD